MLPFFPCHCVYVFLKTTSLWNECCLLLSCSRFHWTGIFSCLRCYLVSVDWVLLVCLFPSVSKGTNIARCPTLSLHFSPLPLCSVYLVLRKGLSSVSADWVLFVCLLPSECQRAQILSVAQRECVPSVVGGLSRCKIEQQLQTYHLSQPLPLSSLALSSSSASASTSSSAWST